MPKIQTIVSSDKILSAYEAIKKQAAPTAEAFEPSSKTPDFQNVLSSMMHQGVGGLEKESQTTDQKVSAVLSDSPDANPLEAAMSLQNTTLRTEYSIEVVQKMTESLVKILNTSL